MLDILDELGKRYEIFLSSEQQILDIHNIVVKDIRYTCESTV